MDPAKRVFLRIREADINCIDPFEPVRLYLGKKGPLHWRDNKPLGPYFVYLQPPPDIQQRDLNSRRLLLMMTFRMRCIVFSILMIRCEYWVMQHWASMVVEVRSGRSFISDMLKLWSKLFANLPFLFILEVKTRPCCNEMVMDNPRSKTSTSRFYLLFMARLQCFGSRILWNYSKPRQIIMDSIDCFQNKW